MQTVHVHRYPIPTEAERASWPEGVSSVSDHWQGWVEDEARVEYSCGLTDLPWLWVKQTS
jgi:hypothetical protein